MSLNMPSPPVDTHIRTPHKSVLHSPGNYSMPWKKQPLSAPPASTAASTLLSSATNTSAPNYATGSHRPPRPSKPFKKHPHRTTSATTQPESPKSSVTPSQTLEVTQPSTFPPQILHTALATLPRLPPQHQDHRIPPIPFSSFHNHLNQANPYKAPGPDGTNLYLLSLCPPWLIHWFHDICNLHLLHPMPPIWLLAHVSLLYKKGDPTNASNYRLIALLNILY